MAYQTMGGDEDTMQGSAPEGAPAPEPQSDSQDGSIFLSRQSLGDMELKEGDTITLKVVSVDPETSDVEAKIISGGNNGKPMEKSGSGDDGYEAAFDKAMPA